MAAVVGSWSISLFDYSSCCLTIWCPCVSFGRIAENVDKGTSSYFAHRTLYCLLGGFTQVGSIYGCIYRTRMRRLYGIEGNQCGDCCVSCICHHISLCQEYRELTAPGFDVFAGWDGNVKMHSCGIMEARAVQGGMSCQPVAFHYVVHLSCIRAACEQCPT